MKTITALELRAKVGRYLDEAAAGERIVVERAGQPICALVPLSDIQDLDPDRIRDRRLAALESIQAFARQHPAPADWDAAEFISRARRERGEHIVRAVEESCPAEAAMTFIQAPRAVVVDASSTVEMLGDEGRWVDRFARWIIAGAQLIAPGHFRLEVANALLKGRRLEPLVVSDGIRRLFAVGIGLTRDDPDALATTIELAVRHNLTVYDAAYVQLALELDAELATQDRAMARAARAEGLTVHD